MNWTHGKIKPAQKLRRIAILSDKGILKKAVIDNMVAEDKRKLIETKHNYNQDEEADHQIAFTTVIPEYSGKYEDLSKRIEQLEKAVRQIIEILSNEQIMTSLSAGQAPPNSRPFFTLISSTSALRKGKINASEIEVDTPCLFIRTSRFLPQHLTVDNLNTAVEASSAVLEMNFDHILENEAFAKNCPISLSEISGVRGNWLTCLSTRLRSESDEKSSQIINGDDFVTIHNSAGSTKFEMKLSASLLQRFKPDLIIVPFDEHQIPISAKRIKKAVDRNVKYETVFAEACKDLSIPFISAVSGADALSERDRSVKNANQMSSGFAYCDLNTFDFDKKLELLMSSKISESSFRIIRGSISPEQVVKLICFTDAFDSSFVDDITAKGMALQLDIPVFSTFNEIKLAEIAVKELLNLWDEKYFDDFSPVLQNCVCPCCKNYKRSYIHHLLKSHEMLAGVLLMMHNLHQYNNWIISLRSLE